MKFSIALASIVLIILTSACNDLPEASFTHSANSYEVGDTVYFTNTCLNADKFEWDFGDGLASTENHPHHIYSAEGNFTVRLVASNSDGVDESSEVVEITQSYPCWTNLSSLQEARNTHGVAVVNDKIYVIGGGLTKVVEEYDVSTDTWTQKADLPTARDFLSVCVLDGKIYAIGGWIGAGFNYNKSLSTVEVYDPATDTWTEKSPMPTARHSHASIAVDGKILVIGGALDYPVEKYYDSIEIYDPETDNWTSKASPPNTGIKSRWGFSANKVNGKIYFIGGNTAMDYPWNDTVPSLRIVEEYDPVSSTWESKSTMPSARHGMATAVVDNQIYVFGGGNSFFPRLALQTVEVYDPAEDSWENKSPMPVGRIAFGACAVKNVIYIVGGGGADDENEIYADVFSYDLTCDNSEQ